MPKRRRHCFGDTAVGELKAGGGEGGKNPLLQNNTFINGIWRKYIQRMSLWLKSSLIIKPTAQKEPRALTPKSALMQTVMQSGAKGASLTNYGTGGEGGISGTNSYLGKNAAGFGSGGGGAAIHDLGKQCKLHNWRE